MKLVVDTDAVAAAMRSPSGASAALLTLLLQRRGFWLLSVAMALEYEAICMLADHRLAANASERDVRNLLNAIFEVIVPVEVHYQWRPQLADAGDEMVLEAAVNSGADAKGDKEMTPRVSTFSLRLPISLKAAVERMAAADGTSMNQFLVMAAAEKLAAIQTAEAYFARFRGCGNVDEAIAFLSRSGGEPPRPGDEIDVH